MYATIHSAEITHRQRAAEIARNAEFARVRGERDHGTAAASGAVRRVLAALRVRRAGAAAPAVAR